jgi:hypothetical protein
VGAISQVDQAAKGQAARATEGAQLAQAFVGSGLNAGDLAQVQAVQQFNFNVSIFPSLKHLFFLSVKLNLGLENRHFILNFEFPCFEN